MISQIKTIRLLPKLILIWAISWPLALLAKDNSNPYRAITNKNAFSLGAEPRLTKPVAEQEIKKASDIKLTGIFQCNGIEKAAIAVHKPKDKLTKPKFLQLAKGEQWENICVEVIDRQNGTVTVTVNGFQRQLNFKDNAYASTLTKTNAKSSSSQRLLPSNETNKDKKEKKVKKSDAEKLAKLNESLLRGKISQASADLKAAVIKGEISGERAKLASMLEKGLIDNRSYQALSRLDDKTLKASISELKQAPKRDIGKPPKEKNK